MAFKVGDLIQKPHLGKAVFRITRLNPDDSGWGSMSMICVQETHVFPLGWTSENESWGSGWQLVPMSNDDPHDYG